VTAHNAAVANQLLSAGGVGFAGQSPSIGPPEQIWRPFARALTHINCVHGSPATIANVTGLSPL
jgi:hypothetical protein